MKRKILKVVCFSLVFVMLFMGLGFLVQNLSQETEMINNVNLTVVLDAGHGGEDGGCIGKTTGIKESDLNLEYTYILGRYLTSMGIKVVYTRKDQNGLYTLGAADKKISDMQKREEIIEKANPQAVISIHMNKFPQSEYKGAQVFYNEQNKNSEALANSIRDCLVKNVENARELTLAGDYYMVNCTKAPSVIVECGFLSNPDEEVLLQNEEYQNKLCYNIFLGIVKYLNIKNN